MQKVLFLFGELDDSDVEWMCATGHKKQLAAGAELIRERKPVDALYIVLDGTLLVCYEAMGGQEVARLTCGEVVGEMSLIDARPPSATVKALDNATVFVLPRTVLSARLQENVGFGARFYRAIAIFLSDRLRSTVGRLGYGKNQPLSEEIEYDDELDMNVLDNIYLAGSRFDRMLRQFMGD